MAAEAKNTSGAVVATPPRVQFLPCIQRSLGRTLRTAITLLVVLVAAASLIPRPSSIDQNRSDTVLTVLIASVATLIIATAFMHAMVWRICVDRRSFWLGLALVMYSAASVSTGPDGFGFALDWRSLGGEDGASLFRADSCHLSQIAGDYV